MPSTLVTITTRRIAIVQLRSWGCLGCWDACHRPYVTSVAVVPLRWVLGFCIEETFSVQRAMLTQVLGNVCCWPLNESSLLVKILTNAGLGKIYASSLFVYERVLPRGIHPHCTFEEEKVIELRRWLGNIALFFGDTWPPMQSVTNRKVKVASVELWRCAHGWSPST